MLLSFLLPIWGVLLQSADGTHPVADHLLDIFQSGDDGYAWTTTPKSEAVVFAASIFESTDWLCCQIQ